MENKCFWNKSLCKMQICINIICIILYIETFGRRVITEETVPCTQKCCGYHYHNAHDTRNDNRHCRGRAGPRNHFCNVICKECKIMIIGKAILALTLSLFRPRAQRNHVNSNVIFKECKLMITQRIYDNHILIVFIPWFRLSFRGEGTGCAPIKSATGQIIIFL